MKSLSEQLQNFDRENFRRVAHNLPEMQDAREPVREAQQVAEVFNGLFAQLRAAFPAAIANSHPGGTERVPPSVAAGVGRTGSPPWSRLPQVCA
jgi:hypothetical protein